MILSNIFNMALAAGAIQGFVIAVMLWRTNKGRSSANRILSIILFFLTYRLIVELLKNFGLVGFDSWTYHVLLEYDWIYGPLLYLYALRFRKDYQGIQRSEYVLFIPVIIEFILSNYVKIQNFYWDGTRESLSWLGCQAYILWMHTPFQLLVFSGLILFYLHKIRRIFKVYTSNEDKPVHVEDVQWLRRIMSVFTVFAMVVIILTSIDYLFFDFAFDPTYRFPVYIAMAALTYWLGFEGYSRRLMPYIEQAEESTQNKVAAVIDQASVDRLRMLMEKEQAYKDPELTLAKLAEMLDMKPYQLTRILNTSLQQNFSDFVNSYRVEEARRLINSPTFDSQTLLSIAFESGFNSKSSFNRIIKKHTGQSPRQLRQNPHE